MPAKEPRRQLGKEERRPFRYRDRATMATIGKARSVAALGQTHLTGLPAWLAWSVVHIRFLISYRSRLRAVLEWAFWYFSGNAERASSRGRWATTVLLARSGHLPLS